MSDEFKIVNLKEKLENRDIYQQLIDDNWDVIGTLDDVGYEFWFDMLDVHSAYQFGVYLNGELAGVGNCVPLWEKESIEDLPDEGWRWAIKSSLKNESGKPKYVSAISATVAKGFRGKKISQRILSEFKRLAQESGAEALIAPVRPSLKSKYPLIPLKEYVEWRRPDGSRYDSWLKIHEGIGGRIVKISKDAMIATRPLEFWKELSGQDYLSSGKYLIDGALNPIEIDIDRQEGVYREPGVWIVHNF